MIASLQHFCTIYITYVVQSSQSKTLQLFTVLAIIRCHGMENKQDNIIQLLNGLTINLLQGSFSLDLILHCKEEFS